jgi:hypothetical protein
MTARRCAWAATLAAALLAPATGANADYFDALQDVALGRDHTPPLVPLRFPAAPQLVPLHGGAFSAANVPTGTDRPAWTSQISGTVSAAAVQLSYHATGTVTGFACDTGQQSLTLSAAHPLP